MKIREKKKDSYTFDDLKPIGNMTIEKRLKSSTNLSRLLLWINLKSERNSSTFKAVDVVNFFNIDSSTVHKMLSFFVRNGLLQKIKRSSKEVMYIPIEKEIKQYIEAVRDKI